MLRVSWRKNWGGVYRLRSQRITRLAVTAFPRRHECHRAANRRRNRIIAKITIANVPPMRVIPDLKITAPLNVMKNS